MKFHGLESVGPLQIEKLPTLPTWTSSDEGRIVYAEDTDQLYYGSSSQWVQFGGSGEVISSGGAVDYVEIKPNEMALDSLLSGCTMGELFDIMKCYDFNQTNDGSVIFDFDIPSIWYTNKNITFDIFYTLDGGLNDRAVKVKTEVWIANKFTNIQEINPIQTGIDTITSSSTNQGKFTKLTLTNGVVSGSNLSSTDATIIVKITRLSSLAEDNYNGTFKLAKVIVRQTATSGLSESISKFQVINKTSDYIIQPSEIGCTFTNYGSGQTMKYTLPPATRIGMRHKIVKSELHTLIIQSSLNDIMSCGSVVDIRKQTGYSYICTCISLNYWKVQIDSGIITNSFGSGIDGSVTISSNKNLNSDILASGRTTPDAVNYSVVSLTNDTATLSTVPALIPGDEVLLISLQGTSSNYSNVGNYETFIVKSVNGSVVTFLNNKTKYYGNGATDDTNIGVSTTNQRVMLQRIPNYANVTINSSITLTCNPWDGVKGGVLFFRVSSVLSNNGIISSNDKGYRGGPGTYQGESLIGLGIPSSNASAGGGGGGGVLCSSSNTGGGGGASYATSGTIGGLEGGCTRGSGATYIYGISDLSKLYFGAGGGGAYSTSPGYAGGGILYIGSTQIINAGTITSISSPTTGTGNDSGGCGSGGSVKIETNDILSGTILARGGLGSSWYNGQVGNGTGKGGDGRIAIFSLGFSGNSTPSAYISRLS